MAHSVFHSALLRLVGVVVLHAAAVHRHVLSRVILHIRRIQRQVVLVEVVVVAIHVAPRVPQIVMRLLLRRSLSGGRI